MVSSYALHCSNEHNLTVRQALVSHTHYSINTMFALLHPTGDETPRRAALRLSAEKENMLSCTSEILQRQCLCSLETPSSNEPDLHLLSAP